MRHSQYLRLTPRISTIYPLSQNLPLKHLFDTPRICPSHLYATLLESSPPSQTIPPPFHNCMRRSQNLPITPRIDPLLNIYMYVRYSHNVPHPHKIYPPFKRINYMRPSQILSILSLRIHPHLNTLCHTLRIYTLVHIYMQHSQNLHLYSRIYLLSTSIFVPPRIFHTFTKYTSLSNIYMRPSQNLPFLPSTYSPFYNYMRPSHNLPLPQDIHPLSTTICDAPRIYTSLPEYTSS